MSSYDALEAFSCAIIGEAEKEKDALLKELQQETEEKLKEKEKELSAKMESAVATEAGKLSMQKGVELSRIKNDSKKKLIAKRAEIFEQVFEKVTENVRKYTETKEYADKLCAEFQAVLKEIGEANYTCYVGEKDLPYIPGAVASKADIIGGFILKAAQEGIYYDCTLRSKIEEQKAYFYANSGLVIH